ncbi:unnamed protein product [Paramecium primaurelia]|uniref:Choline transporter-like protein n=1 Tax=Paramecium primaurelia TaxID=5886 RepID=A0A8S1MAJ8_PARPR|nr:unnamed protein product [Paramecium primaurelia]
MSNNAQLLPSEWEYPEQNPDYKGNDLDRRLEQGPIEDRGCTDCIWCILYLIMWGGLITIGIIALSNGSPDTLFLPYNSDGQQCGVSENFESCPYSYLMNTTQIDDTQNGNFQFYCVVSCPSNVNEQVNYCTVNGIETLDTLYGTYDYMSVCSPYKSDPYWDLTKDFFTFTASEADFQDIGKTWAISLFVCVITLILANFIMFLVKKCASCLVWGVLILYFSLLILFGFLFYYSGKGDFSNAHFGNSYGWCLTIAIIFWSIAGISFLMLGCYYKRIYLAIAVIKAAADFTRDVWQVVIVPLSIFGVMIAFLIFWIYSTTYLMSYGSPEYNKTPFPEIDLNSGVIGMIIGNSVAFYWNCQFAMAFSQYVVASCCCMWYFHHMGVNLHRPVFKSIKRGLMHHSGSLALGSLILTFVAVLRFTFDLLHKIFKQGVQQNKGATGCLKCWFGYYGCIIHCFERFIRFITQNAYIMVAMTGKSFCKSAHDGYYLIFRHKTAVAITDGIGEIFSTLANLSIGITATFIGFIMITQIDHYSNQISSPVLPTVFFAFISLTLSSIFMNVYGMGIDTILLCYMADRELFSTAKSVPQSLQEFLDKYQK